MFTQIRIRFACSAFVAAISVGIAAPVAAQQAQAAGTNAVAVAGGRDAYYNDVKAIVQGALPEIEEQLDSPWSRRKSASRTTFRHFVRELRDRLGQVRERFILQVRQRARAAVVPLHHGGRQVTGTVADPPPAVARAGPRSRTSRARRESGGARRWQLSEQHRTRDVGSLQVGAQGLCLPALPALSPRTTGMFLPDCRSARASVGGRARGLAEYRTTAAGPVLLVSDVSVPCWKSTSTHVSAASDALRKPV